MTKEEDLRSALADAVEGWYDGKNSAAKLAVAVSEFLEGASPVAPAPVELTTAGTNITGPDACANAGRIDGAGAGGRPVAWHLIGSTEVFLASEFQPDTEHRDEWSPLYARPPVPSDQRLREALAELWRHVAWYGIDCAQTKELAPTTAMADCYRRCLALAGEPTPVPSDHPSNRGAMQAIRQARAALHKHSMLPWGQPDYPTPTPGASLLYEARSYLDAALAGEPTPKEPG